MKRMILVILTCLALAGLLFPGTNTESGEQSPDRLAGSEKSNMQAAENEKAGMSSSASVGPSQVSPDGSTNSMPQKYVIIPFCLSIFPLTAAGIKTIDYVQINIGAGYCDILNGLSLGFVNIAGENARGADFSLVGITGGNFMGLQCSLVTYAGGDFRGVQFGLVNYVNGDFSVFQSGLINITGENFNGFQTGHVNVTCGSFSGFQAGLINFTAVSNKGFQAGLVNIDGNASGLQLGLVNLINEEEGTPIGLVSIVAENGQTHLLLSADETGFGNIALINGSKTVYNIYTAGMDQTLTLWTYGLGLGVHMPLEPFYINMEIIASSVSHIEKWDGEDTLDKIRIYAGFTLFDHLSVIAGISLNYYRSWKGNSAFVQPFYCACRVFDNGGYLWPGFFAGIMF
jgi:hypothetical protein